MADDKPYLICAFCQYDETKFPIKYWHIVALHVALDHGVNVREIYRSKRVEASSHAVTWRLPDGTGWVIEWKKNGFRPGVMAFDRPSNRTVRRLGSVMGRQWRAHVY